MKLPVHEKRLLDFAREQFGEQLSQFILTGLGEDVGQSGGFIINYVSEGNTTLKRYVEVITYEPTDSSRYLPYGRNPLVLIALLHLLISSDQGSLNTLRFELKEVLSILGWKVTRKARSEVEEAIERYFKLTYQCKMDKSELADAKLNFFEANEAMLSEYEIIYTDDIKSTRLVFNEHFIEQLLSRALFGIDWNNVRSIARLSSPKKK